MKDKRLLIYCIFSVLIFVTSIIPLSYSFALDIAQRIEIPSSPNPVGSGARALGIGGAFIAIADDATAASWNPGGLIQLEVPEFSFVGASFHRTEDNMFDYRPGASGEQSVSRTSINYLSFVYPFDFWGPNMIVSLTYQQLYDFTRRWNFSFKEEGDTPLSTETYTFDYNLEGSLSALGISYCAEIDPRFSLGFTLNFWSDPLYKNEWEDKRSQTKSVIYENGNPTETIESLSIDKYSFGGIKFPDKGINFHVGFLWEVIRYKLSMGAVLKTPFKADLEHYYLFSSKKDSGGASMNLVTFDEKATLEMPMSYGIGLSYKFSDAFITSLDIYRTEWDDLVLSDSNGPPLSPVTGRSVSESNIKPTYQIRMGTEYFFKEYEVPLRFGIFYDPAPAEGNPDDIFGFSVGSGFTYKHGIIRFIFDIAYQYRFGNKIGRSYLKNWGFSQDIEEHTLYSSIITRF